MNIEVTVENMKFFEAMSSETRVKIIEMLKDMPLNVKDIAARLELSSAIVTRHIQQLESAGIVKSESLAGVRGLQKICRLSVDRVVLGFKAGGRAIPANCHSIPVGQYQSYNIKPTCGLASAEKLIGILDDPRYFADPEHTKADILWFGSGWVDYRIPNYLLKKQKLKSIEISLEICSEAPGYNEDRPSDIVFSLNGTRIGMWTSPGDFGGSRGVFTPEWWNHGTQHGLLKTIRICEDGSFIDGVRCSGVRITDLKIDYGKEILLRIENPETAANVGGVNIFGKGFGNYNQDINVVMD